MGTTHKPISVIDLGLGALDFVPDLPELCMKFLGLVTLRPASKRSLGQFFETIAGQYPANVFIKTEHAVYTYAQANERANQMARGLISLGVKQGDSVALMSENCAELLLAVLAIAKIGAVAALINTNQRGDVLLHSLKLVKPVALLLGQQGVPVLQELLDQQPKLLGKSPVFTLAQESTDHAAFPPLRPLFISQSVKNLAQTGQIIASTPCFYIFTSGTTGLPKASVMTHYRWLLAMTGMSSVIRLKPEDVFYCCLPMYHNNALTVSLGVAMAAGATFAIDTKFSASRFWQRIQFFEATAFCYIGELLRYLINQPSSPTDQKHAVHSIIGNGLRPEIWGEFEDRFGIHRILEFYGASESNMGFMNAFGLRETVGFSPIPYQIIECDPDTEMPVRNAKGHCKSVKRGEVGLLVSEVTSRRPFDGYTDASANEKKLLRNVFKKGDVWFNSGDLVRRQGWWHIQFVDRLGDTFRWKGENVATSEVEGVLGQLPWIEHAAVYGVKVDGADGRAGMAAITLKAGCQFDAEGLLQHLQRSLPAYAVPLFVRLTPAAETTGTFKYQKVSLKKEGYDNTLVKDPLYFWDSQNKKKAYQPYSTE
ncbi:MAG: long-chain-acyl-CoA synthetase [Limnobacter sp.]|nr:long-chain-acyl-CoA synthetase [Limnobacter sp.]